MKILPRFPLALLALGFIAVPWSGAEDKEQNDTYQVKSELDVRVPGYQDPMTYYHRVRYTLKRQKQIIHVVLEEIQSKLSMKQREARNVTMNRQGIVSIEDGVEERGKFEDAPADMQKTLRDSFGTPLCKIEVDETGKQLKRTMTAGPGAKDLVEAGYVDLCCLFHPPFLMDKNRWTAPLELRLPDKSSLKEELTYEKTADSPHGMTRVKVFGSLKLKQDASGWVGGDAKVKGQMTYENESKRWVVGKIEMHTNKTPKTGKYKGQTVPMKSTIEFELIKPK